MLSAVRQHAPGLHAQLPAHWQRNAHHKRCAWQCEDHTFSQSSRQTYALGLLGFAAVVSDAALLERVVSMDTQDAPEGRYVAPAGGGRGGQGAPPTPRQIEGLGGHFWYEAR